MASSLGITLAIVAGAVAIGLTAGLAAPAIGLTGATVLGSGAVLGVGGMAFSLGTAVAVGSIALGAGMALTQSASTPDPITQVHRQLATTDDPESPWEWVYGEVVKGAMRAWQGIGGNKDKFSGVDDILACHPCEALIAIQVGDWYLPIVTNNAGDANANGKGLILNENRTAPYDDVPSGWYVPVPGPNSPFHANDQSQTNNDDTWHIAVRFRGGDQTATQDLMTTVFGTKYSSVARKFIGLTVCHIVFRARTNLGTVGPPPTVTYHLRGKNDIRDHTGIGSEDYRTNAAHIFCDYTREQLGLGPTDYANLQAAAAECDDTTWDPDGTAARYAFHGVIRDDMDIHEALRLISTHMAGGWCERGDKVVLWTGTAKTAWADGPLVPDDFAGPVTILPPDEDAWANTLTPHFVPRTALDEDGKTMLTGKMLPVKQDVTSAVYVGEDGGEILRQDIKFQACPLSRRAKFMAWTALKQMRLGASYVRKFKKRALVLEVGDVVALDDPDWVPNGTLFQVASKSGPDPRDFSVELGLVRYLNGIYNPDATVTEDAIGVVPHNRSSEIPLITGLAAAVEEDSAQMQADGTITMDVVVTWDQVDNLLVQAGGDVRVAWKRTSVSWPRKSTTADGDSIQTILAGLRQGLSYHIRARAEGVPSAGREGKPVGLWSDAITFTPDALADETTPPRLPGVGQNLMEGSRFESRKHREHNFNLVDSRADGTAGRLADANMTIDFQATGGFFGPYRLRVLEDASSEPIGDTWRIDYEPYIPTEWGAVIRTGIGCKRNSGSADVLFQLALRFYDANKGGGFLETQTIDDVLTVSSGLWHFFQGKGQAPENAAFFRPQLIWKKSSTAGAPVEASFDGWYADDVPIIQSPLGETEGTVEDETWSNYGLGNRDIAGQGYITNGTEELEIDWQVRGRVQNVSGSALAERTVLRARLVRNDFNGVLADVVVTGIKVVAALPAGAAAGSASEDVMFRFTSEDAPPAGEWRYRIQNSIQGDEANADGKISDLKIAIRRL